MGYSLSMPKAKRIGKVFDPVERVQHLCAPPLTDQVTLCGQTDWLGQAHGVYDTDDAVDCQPCRWIFDFCKQGVFPQ